MRNRGTDEEHGVLTKAEQEHGLPMRNRGTDEEHGVLMMNMEY